MTCTCSKGAGCGHSVLCTSRIAAFEFLSDQEQRLLVENARHRSLPAGQAIFREGDMAEQILVMHRGRAKLVRYSLEGREYVLDILGAGDIYGEQRMFTGLPHEVSCITLEPTNYCEILRPQIEALIMREPVVGIKLLEALGRKYSRASRLQEILSINDAQARLAAFLLHRARELGTQTIKLVRSSIAATINLRPETISRKLNDMEREGLLALQGHKTIRILNRDGLQRIVDAAE